MKRKCRKIKCVIKSIPTKQSVADDFIQKSEIREKRIGIVFKVIYVIAIFFAAFFIQISNSLSEGLTDVYIMYTCCASFLFCVLIYMLIYIFNELKCLKLCSDDLSKLQEEKTECSYSVIFDYFIQGGIAVVLCMICLMKFKNKLNRDTLIPIISFGSIIAAILSLIPCKKCANAIRCISHILWTVTVIGILIAVALVEV